MDELQHYDYELPAELIARQPPQAREDARLLVVDRQTGGFSDHSIRDLPELLRPADCLVLNDTQVIPARLLGYRTATGGKWEGLFLEAAADGTWLLLSQTRGKLRIDEQLTVVAADAGQSSLQLTVIGRTDDGSLVVRPETGETDHLILLGRVGTVPLPPYVGREKPTDLDWQRYQTTFASRPGAIAAPTAGLHFTPQLLQACAQRGISQTCVTLHVGVGTFRSINTERLEEHSMHSEWCELTSATVETIGEARDRGGRIVAIGTTSVRTLESAVQDGMLQPFRGPTELFIRPPYKFEAVDSLLTNFHLPRTTLLVLVSAFAGRELIRSAYEHAIRERYRFYSYGDAMLIL